ncbi:MAG: TadE/TadG family type IV pilus assembly protein [Propionibacteriaceae bacterium]
MRSDRGAVATEWAILVPAVVLIVSVMVAGSRLAMTRSAIADAAYAGARSAAANQSGSLAAVKGKDIAIANLNGVLCNERRINVDTTAFRVTSGQPALVKVHIYCVVPLADLLIPGMPGSISVTKEGVAALDTYRERS